MDIINDDIIRAILTSQQLNEVTSVQVLNWHIDGIAEKVKKFTTQICKLIIRYQPQPDPNTSPKEIIFIVKDPTKAPLYELFKMLGLYDNEIAMYSQVLPQMYAIDEDEHFTPKQYYFDDNNLLVLEDLSQFGYKCINCIDQLDIEHCIYAFKYLAKFHALSVKLQTTVGLPELIKTNFMFSTENAKNIDIVVSQHMPMFINSIEQHLKDRYPNMIANFENITPEILINTHKISSAGTFRVLNHGDFNTNNIMFKYDKFGTIKNVKLIDFQLTSWGSPAVDLIFFTITSMKFEVYRKYFPLLLKIYLDTLNRVLYRLKCPTYNMQSLLNDIDALYPKALYTLSCVNAYVMCDQEDQIDTESIYKDGKLDLVGGSKAFKLRGYQDVSNKWFEYFARKGTLRIDEEENVPSESSTN